MKKLSQKFQKRETFPNYFIWEQCKIFTPGFGSYKIWKKNKNKLGMSCAKLSTAYASYPLAGRPLDWS